MNKIKICIHLSLENKRETWHKNLNSNYSHLYKSSFLKCNLHNWKLTALCILTACNHLSLSSEFSFGALKWKLTWSECNVQNKNYYKKYFIPKKSHIWIFWAVKIHATFYGAIPLSHYSIGHDYIFFSIQFALFV